MVCTVLGVCTCELCVACFSCVKYVRQHCGVCTRVKVDLADKQPAVREGEVAAEDVRRPAFQRQCDCT